MAEVSVYTTVLHNLCTSLQHSHVRTITSLLHFNNAWCSNVHQIQCQCCFCVCLRLRHYSHQIRCFFIWVSEVCVDRVAAVSTVGGGRKKQKQNQLWRNATRRQIVVVNHVSRRSDSHKCPKTQWMECYVMFYTAMKASLVFLLFTDLLNLIGRCRRNRGRVGLVSGGCQLRG